MKAIIYQSATGHTQRYAEKLGAILGLPCYNLFEAVKYLNARDEVIFMGWIRNRDLMGYGLMLKRYTVRAICVVGASPDGTRTLELVRKRYRINEENTPLFYLQGGIDNKIIRGSDRRVLEMTKNELAKKVTRNEKKGIEPTPEINGLLRALLVDSDHVCKENLKEVIKWHQGL